jgi:hypothetical protein
VKTFYIETPCLTYGAAAGSASTPKLNSFEAETAEAAIALGAAFWAENGYRVAGQGVNVTAAVEARRVAALAGRRP